MASLGLDLGDDDMLNDGNDGSAPLAECVGGTAPLLPSTSAGTSGEGGAADASEAHAHRRPSACAVRRRRTGHDMVERRVHEAIAASAVTRAATGFGGEPQPDR